MYSEEDYIIAKLADEVGSTAEIVDGVFNIRPMNHKEWAAKKQETRELITILEKALKGTSCKKM